MEKFVSMVLSKKTVASLSAVALLGAIFISMKAGTGNEVGQPLHAAAGDQRLAACTGIIAPDSVTVGQQFNASVFMQNTGSTTWTAASLYRLGAQNPQDNKTWGMNRLELAGSAIAPNQSAAFMFVAKAPTTPGSYSFTWQMVQDGVTWFGQTCTKTITVNPVPLVNLAACSGITAPDTVLPGQKFDAQVNMQNTGTTKWNPSEAYRLGSQSPQDNQMWGMNRVPVLFGIAPNSTASFIFKATAPQAVGTYSFDWQMVQDGVAWFGSKCTKSIRVAAPVVSSSSSSVRSSSVSSVVSSAPVASSSSSVAAQTSKLNIAVQSIGSLDTAVKNEKNVNFLRFKARVNGSEKILLTQTVFRSEDGSLLNAQNYTLWVDTDDDSIVDTKLQSGVAAQSNAVTFNDLTGGGYILSSLSDTAFEVHGDIASNLTNNYLRLGFDIGANIAFYVEAESEANGASLSGIRTLNSSGTPDAANQCTGNCEITVQMTTSKSWKLVNQGDLIVAKYYIPSRSHQLLGGALGEEILRIDFQAQNEDIDVTNLQFNSSGSTASSIDRLELYKLNAVTPFATATVGGCGSDDVLTTNNGNGGATIVAFCANMQNQQLVVKEGTDQVVSIRPRMKSDEQGAVSNQTIQIWMTKQAVSNNVTGSGAIRARGFTSSNNLLANDEDNVAEGEVIILPTAGANVGHNANIVGSVNKTVLAKITSITNANPDSDNTNVPTGISPFGQFTFTAATNTNTLNGLNKATLGDIIFNVDATNVRLDPMMFRFYNKADSSNKLGCLAMTTGGQFYSVNQIATGQFLVLCPNMKGSVVDTRIPSESSMTFVLEGNVTNPKVGTAMSILQASITGFTTPAGTLGINSSHIRWIDEDTSGTSFFWIEYGETTVKSTLYKS